MLAYAGRSEYQYTAACSRVWAGSNIPDECLTKSYTWLAINMALCATACCRPAPGLHQRLTTSRRTLPQYTTDLPAASAWSPENAIVETELRPFFAEAATTQTTSPKSTSLQTLRAYSFDSATVAVMTPPGKTKRDTTNLLDTEVGLCSLRYCLVRPITPLPVDKLLPWQGRTEGDEK